MGTQMLGGSMALQYLGEDFITKILEYLEHYLELSIYLSSYLYYLFIYIRLQYYIWYFQMEQLYLSFIILKQN